MAPPYTVCGKCGWWELDSRMGWSCRKCGTGCKNTGPAKPANAARDPADWHTVQAKKQQPRKPAWPGWGKGWQHSWEAEGGSQPALPDSEQQAVIAKLLQLLKEHDVEVPAELEPRAAGAEPGSETSPTEAAVEKWNELMRAKHELKKRGDVLGKKQKQLEKAKEALAAAVAAQDEAAAAVAEATGALTKASQEYTKIMPGGGPPEGMEEVNDEELNAKSPDEIHAMLTEEARKAEQAAAAIKKLRAIVERNVAKKNEEVDAEMADAEQQLLLRQAADAKDAETKRKEEQGRDEAAKKRRMAEDSEREKAQAEEAAARAAAAKEVTDEAERAAAAAAKAKAKAKAASR